MRIPNRFIEHPIEALIAGFLLLALLFVSADPQASAPGAQNRIATSQKM